ncbi:unnamed protein product [Cylicocyclus nassatus]|uniref:Sm domain-containing protein n=1 Tax=Cylicocyclus nassatus TaxID=53992 RepID=A0AA36M7F3_CYLNA|nr:unnamed protein product [Cylicocyclus nassatus]
MFLGSPSTAVSLRSTAVMDPFSPDFDPCSVLQRSPEGGDRSTYGSLEDFETTFASEQPEIARLICENDRSANTKSKKQEKRERVARLEGMTLKGRQLFEKNVRAQDGLIDLEALHGQWSAGPMSLLFRALKRNLRVEVYIRALNRVDHIACGYLIAFDRHVNLVLRDVDEVALPGRKEERTFGRRKFQEHYILLGMRWRTGGTWPHPSGVCRTVLQRHIPCSMIKGDTVVLVRLLT